VTLSRFSIPFFDDDDATFLMEVDGDDVCGGRALIDSK
jgi:hypothetical protein